MFKPNKLVSVASASRAVKASIILGVTYAAVAPTPTGFARPATLPTVPIPLATGSQIGRAHV